MYVVIGGYNYYNMFCHLPLLSDTTSAHTFLYRPAFSICCTSLPSSCLCLLNTQDNVPQANMANFISHWGLASNYLKMNMDKCILSIYAI